MIFEAPAQVDVAEAFDWYEQKSYGLGGFLRVVAADEEQLGRHPESFLRPHRAGSGDSC